MRPRIRSAIYDHGHDHGHKEFTLPTSISKSALKARMLEVFREVEATGEELVVTDHGQPVLKIVPFRRQEGVDEVFADLRRRARLPSDEELTAPLGQEPFADSELGALL